MMSKSLLNCLFLTYLILHISVKVFGQSPCITPPPLQGFNTAGVESSTICNGDPITLKTASFNSCPTCTYIWSDGNTGPINFAFSSGFYSVTVTDTAGNCTGVSPELELTETFLLKPIFEDSVYNICTDLNSTQYLPTLTVSNPCPTCLYRWVDSLGNEMSAAAVGNTTFTPTDPGGYYVEVSEPSSFSGLYYEHFDNNNDYTTNITECTDNNGGYFTLTNGNGLGSGVNYGYNWGSFFAAQNLTKAGCPASGGVGQILIEDVNIANASNLGLYVMVAEDDNANGTQDWDPSDFLHFDVQITSGGVAGAWQNVLWFESDITDNSEPMQDTDFDGTGDGTALSNYFQYFFNNPITGTGQTMDIRIQFSFNDVDEDAAIDYLIIGGLISPCIVKSEMMLVGDVTVSEPPISGDANTICDGNSVNLSTINCQDCEYEWHFYDFPPEEKLIISGLFDVNINASTEPRGLELYAIGNIPDLSAYSLQTTDDPDGSAGLQPVFQLPAIPLPAGSYFYVTTHADSFEAFFGFEADVEASPAATFSADDMVQLIYDGSIVDQFGNTGSNTSWIYTDGWIYRNKNESPNNGSFSDVNWTQNISVFTACDSNDVCGTPFPYGTFTTDAEGSVDQIIPNADSSSYNTTIQGLYSVLVKYPNACALMSDDYLIDTSLFNPNIKAVMPNPFTNQILSSTDTSYMCFNSYVDLKSVQPFQAPPTWTYQWLENNVPIAGATGYNHRIYNPGFYSVSVTNEQGCSAVSNVITVIESTNGSEPTIAATDLSFCDGISQTRISTPKTIDCTFKWFLSTGNQAPILPNDSNFYDVTSSDLGGLGAGGYFAVITDTISSCVYSTPIIEIGDTTYPAPVISANGQTECSPTPISLVTDPCASCSFVWMADAGGQFVTYDSTLQFTQQIDTSGKYRLEIVYPNGCRTQFSNTIEATFQTINAGLITPADSAVCNGDPVLLQAIPDSATLCVGCSYTFLRDGIAMQIPGDSTFQQEISLEGTYQVAVTNVDNCSDTSSTVDFIEVSVATQVYQTTDKICNPTAFVTVYADSCENCTYEWDYRATNSPTSIPLNEFDTFYTFQGYGSDGTYILTVNKFGCEAVDSVYIDSVPALQVEIDYDTIVSESPTICNGSPVLLFDTCGTCVSANLYQYQWFYNGDSIIGASFESFQTDSAGDYSVEITDINNCKATSDILTVQEFSQPADFDLEFDSLGVAIPLTYGLLDMRYMIPDTFLTPSSLYLNASGSFSSLTAGAAMSGNILDVNDAGPGLHYITYTYTDSNALGKCEFSATDVIEVLTGVDMSVTNTNPVSVPFEACLYDNLQITITNFTFQPDTVRFVAGGGATIDIAVTPVISQTAGVWSGTINVQVPDGARTGKITLTNGVDTYESTNFYQIHNPSVAISIQSTTDPICSNLDSATFEGLPAGGYFSAHYVGLDTTSNPELMVAGTDTLDLTAVAGYMAGEVDVVMMYHYNPRFTNDSLCPQQVLDSLTVTVLDGQLDSVHYTPIANSQPIEDLEDLTLLTYPVSARYYAYSYSGTYVAINDLLPNTIAPTGAFVGEDSIQYQINNAGCTNFSDDAIDIWPAPTVLDSIPENQCSLGDTVFVYRNADSLKVFYRGAMIYADTLYRYRSIGTTSYPAAPASPLVDYDEQYNIMEFTSSNGGITTFNSNQGQEEYYFVPANVTAGSTTLNFKFKYERTATFYDTLFDTILSTENTEYYIAEVSKTIFIENPSNVQLNSLLQTDTIFCPVNQTTLLTGQPLGGQYYLDYDTIINNVFNPVSPAALQGTYRLTYVYEGQSCVDSAVTNILIPPTFSINLSLDTFCETSPDKDIYYDGYDPLNVTFLDTNSVQFYVKGIQSIPVFSPVNVFGNTGAPEDVPVVYEIADTFGCVESAASIFTIIPNPNIGTTFPTDTTVCENDPQMPIDLFIYEYDSTICNTLTSFGCGLFNPDSIDVSSATGGVIDQGGVNAIDQLFFYPANAGTGTHQIVYHFRDSNTCTSTRILTVNVLELPNVNMTLVNDVAIGTPFQFICEEDSIRLFGQPFETDVTRFGYGSFTTNGTSPTSFDPATQDFEPAVPGVLPSQVDEVIYYWFEDLLGCRDTSSHTFRIRNFTDTFKIQGLPDTICAYDNEFPITIDLISTTAPSLDSFGWFGSSYPQAFSQIDSFPTNTDSISFNPGNSGIEFADREVDLTFYIRDPSGSCFDQFDTSVIVQTLPNIYLSEFSATDLNEIDVPGSTLLNPQPDGYYHVCIDRPELQLIPYNFYGNYLPVQDILLIGAPIPLATYQDSAYNSVSGPNVDSIFFPGAIAYYFNPIMAGPGLDTIIHFYTNPNGCTSKDTTLIFVDDLPALSFTNLTAPDPVSGNYVFCEKDDSINISPSPSGVTALSLTFNGQPINTVPFVMNPQALADPAGLIQLDYALQYNYTGQVYADGGICADTIIDTISILPAPNLDWVSVPSSFCLTNDVPNFPLSATPYGGTFSDISFGIEGKPAILNDSLFNPFAQAGTRTIVYEYVDGNNCYDSIQYKIGIYSKPKLDFFINGGCQGLNIEFVADSFPYGFDTTSLSLDSISMVIWNYGDGTADTMTNFSNQWDIPSSNHTYSSNGIFSPSLTVVNQGVCDSVFTRRIVISPLFTPLDTVPYEEFFDGDPLLMGWMQESADTASDDGFVTDSLWQLGETIGNVINTQGNVGWTTGSYSTYSGGKSAWVYSPCFDLTQLDKPMIEMSVWRNSLSSIDGAVLQYHDNISNSWKVLGRYGKGINWYQDGYVVSAPGEQINVPIGWSGTSTGFENARYRLDNIDADLRNRNDVRFRVSFSSDSSTLAGAYDGFAFDSVRIGNRSRSVLVEHFSGTGYPGLETIEERLYETIFSNLYGRDVTLIQYFTDNYTPTTTYHDFNDVDNRQRELFYGVEDDNQVRVDGKDYVTFTSDLLEYPHPDSLPGSMKLEFLDIDMLEDAKFKIDFQFPGISIVGNQLSVDVDVEVLQDMPSDLYSLHVVITEDSLLTAANHEVQAVMRTMLPNNSGTSYAQPFAIGETMTVNQVWNFTAANHNHNALHAVAFMQNMVTKEVYQVAHTRDILSLNGPYIFADSTISVDNIKDAEGYEIVDLNLYPNPTEQQFNVSFSKALSEDHEWKLIDAVGRVLQQGIVQEGSTIMQVNTDKLSAGMYIFSINNDKVYVQRKVVVRKP